MNLIKVDSINSKLLTIRLSNSTSLNFSSENIKEFVLIDVINSKSEIFILPHPETKAHTINLELFILRFMEIFYNSIL